MADNKDYHPEGHISFASSHPGHKVYSDLELKDARGILYEQKLWPDHCIQGTKGCEIAPEIMERIVKRGDKAKLVRKVSRGDRQGLRGGEAGPSGLRESLLALVGLVGVDDVPPTSVGVRNCIANHQ